MEFLFEPFDSSNTDQVVQLEIAIMVTFTIVAVVIKLANRKSRKATFWAVWIIVGTAINCLFDLVKHFSAR